MATEMTKPMRAHTDKILGTLEDILHTVLASGAATAERDQLTAELDEIRAQRTQIPTATAAGAGRWTKAAAARTKKLRKKHAKTLTAAEAHEQQRATSRRAQTTPATTAACTATTNDDNADQALHPPPTPTNTSSCCATPPHYYATEASPCSAPHESPPVPYTPRSVRKSIASTSTTAPCPA